MAKPEDSLTTRNLEISSVPFSHGDVRRVVENFYAKVAVDPVLGVPFASVKDWPHHIERLTHFWWVKFGGEPYMDVSYDPVTKHFEAGFSQPFLERWLTMFRETAHETLTPEQAELWCKITERMGHALTMKNEMYKASRR